MTRENAIYAAKFLRPSDGLWNYKQVSAFYNGRLQEVLAQKLKGIMPQNGFTQKNQFMCVPDQLVCGYSNMQETAGVISWATAPVDSLKEVKEALGINISIECLDLICFLIERREANEILESDEERLFDEEEADWINDRLCDCGLERQQLLLCLQYIIYTVLSLEQPLSDEKYDKEIFLDGLSVSSWCETLFDSLNIFELTEESYYLTFPYWLSFLTSYSGNNSGVFWCFNGKGRIAEYIVWRKNNQNRKDEAFKALDQAVSVLVNPFLTDESWCLSRNEIVSVLFTMNTGMECINPFFSYAQEIFDSLYQEFLKIKKET